MFSPVCTGNQLKLKTRSRFFAQFSAVHFSETVLKIGLSKKSCEQNSQNKFSENEVFLCLLEISTSFWSWAGTNKSKWRYFI